VTMDAGRDTSALEYSADLQLALSFTLCKDEDGKKAKSPSQLTDDEKQAQLLADAEASKEAYELKLLQLDAKERLIAKGITDKDMIESLLGNIKLTDKETMESSVDNLVSVFSTIESNTEKRIKAELLQNTPKPPPDEPDDDIKWDKLTATEKVKLKTEQPELYEKLRGK